uniref:Major facilitator superfamily (MFS) profile domain-containing protein n=1 Tax=Moniliophthora roreri TaxID=221103 RepID=A0A0W0GEF2_MONRR
MIFVFFGFGDIGWTPLPYLYCSEILTYNLRAKAMSYFSLVQALALTFSMYINPVELEILRWKYYAVYVAVLSVYFVLARWLFIETKGHTIEQISALFD